MAQCLARCKQLFLFILTFCAATTLKADWRIEFCLANLGSGDSAISAYVYLGESKGAADGFDTYDFPLGPPPNNLPYVRAYFPHSDWGTTYNGNYMIDLMSFI